MQWEFYQKPSDFIFMLRVLIKFGLCNKSLNILKRLYFIIRIAPKHLLINLGIPLRN